MDPEHGADHANEVDHRLDVDSIVGNVVQAGHIRGGVHVHPPADPPRGDRFTPRQLPAPGHVFVNRNAEIEQLWDHLADTGSRHPHPVIVVAGSGGVGKTSLALQWLHRIRDRFEDGDLYCNLQGYGAGQPVAATVVLERMLAGLGVPSDRIPFELEDRAALYRSLIAGRRVLILLDNAANAAQVRPLIPGAAGPLLVVTSRSRLPSLAVRDGVRYVQLDVLGESDAVALVNEVTEGGRSDADAEVNELVRLCARLPLALRIAAERAVSRPGMRLAELIEDLRDASGLWEALSVEDGAEVDDVRTVFAWSYRSLPESAAWVFRVIGLHPGADIGLAAIAAAAGTSRREARRATDVLVGAFLLDHANGSRFQMHDLLRAYANAESRSHDTGPALTSVLERMFCWYAASAANAAATLANIDRRLPAASMSPDVRPETFDSASEARSWFDAERLNLLAVARFAEASEMPSHALALALAASPIYTLHHHFDDWSETSAIAQRAAGELPDTAAKAAAAENRGKYLLRRGAYDRAREAFAAALRFYEQAGDQRGAAAATNALGLVCLRDRRLDEATERFAAAAETFAILGDRGWEAVCRSNLSEARIELGEPRRVLTELDGLLPRFIERDDAAMHGNTLWLQARARRLDGDPAGARDVIEQALAIAEAAENKMWEGFWLIEAARIQLELGDTEAAMESCQLAAALQRQIGDKSREAMALDCTGGVLAQSGRAEEALAFHLQAAHQFNELGERWNEGLARLGAAEALSGLERAEAEREQLHAALGCLDQFADPRAEELRRQVRGRLE
ncbi:ATP-binding protein [Glycomyces tarimensis]